MYNLIVQYGVFGGMFVMYAKYLMKQNNELITSFKNAINENTKVTRELLGKIGGDPNE